MSRCCRRTAAQRGAASSRLPRATACWSASASASASMAWWSAARPSLDASLVTGESLPVPAAPGTQVFAGTLNLGAALTVRATATGAATLLAECVRLIEAAEARRSRFVVLADRVARRYAPAVHLAALLTFLWWFFVAGVPAGEALLIASAVLIITCPCALALAVPVVQVIATGAAVPRRRAAEVADRAGAAGRCRYGCIRQDRYADRADAGAGEGYRISTRRRCASRRRLRRVAAIRWRVRWSPPRDRSPVADGVIEDPGQGLSAGELWLGSPDSAGSPRSRKGSGPELWLARPGMPPVRFVLQETLRADAAATVQRLRELGFDIHLLSGDRTAAVARVAAALGIADWQRRTARRCRRSPRSRRWRVGPQSVDGRRRTERQPLARRGNRIGLAGKRRRHQPDRGGRGVPGQQARRQ